MKAPSSSGVPGVVGGVAISDTSVELLARLAELTVLVVLVERAMAARSLMGRSVTPASRLLLPLRMLSVLRTDPVGVAVGSGGGSGGGVGTRPLVASAASASTGRNAAAGGGGRGGTVSD